jgi:hypothetical protein
MKAEVEAVVVGPRCTDRLENSCRTGWLSGWLLLSNGTVMLIAPRMFG